jgi:hypothetical protein
MANFSRSHLKYVTYTWNNTEIVSKTIDGFPDNILLNRIEGYEVLCFINRYMETHNYSLTSTFEQIEEVIRTRLPLDRKSYKTIKEWLEASYTF